MTAQDPTLRLYEIAALLNVTPERARQIANQEGFPAPVDATPPRRRWRRDDVEAWIDDVRWWESKPWRKQRYGRDVTGRRTDQRSEGLSGRRWHWQRFACGDIELLPVVDSVEDDAGAIWRPGEADARPDATFALLSELPQARTIWMDEPNL